MVLFGILLVLWEFCKFYLAIFTLCIPTLPRFTLTSLDIQLSVFFEKKKTSPICAAHLLLDIWLFTGSWTLKENWLFISQKLLIAHSASVSGGTKTTTSFSMLDPVWLELYGSCTHCHNHCITCTALLYPENTPLTVFSYLWLLPSLHRLFSNNPWASRGGGVTLISH